MAGQASRLGAAEVVVGEVQFEMGRWDDAARSASRAIDRDPRHAGAYVLRGMVQEREGGVAAAKSREASLLAAYRSPAAQSVAAE